MSFWNSTDLSLSLIFIAGMIQLGWISLILQRRHIPNQRIQESLFPLLSIWVLLWPIYTHSLWIVIAAILLWLASNHTPRLINTPSTRLIQQSFQNPGTWNEHSIALVMAAIIMQIMPATGLGLGLMLTIAYPLGLLPGRFIPQRIITAAIVATLSMLILYWTHHVYHSALSGSQYLGYGIIIASLYWKPFAHWNSPIMICLLALLLWFF